MQAPYSYNILKVFYSKPCGLPGYPVERASCILAYHIFVVTSDGPEQSQVLGNGSYRVAVDDLVKAVNEDKAVQTTFISHNNRKNLRSEIGRAIPASIQEKLDKLRKK